MSHNIMISRGKEEGMGRRGGVEEERGHGGGEGAWGRRGGVEEERGHGGGEGAWCNLNESFETGLWHSLTAIAC